MFKTRLFVKPLLLTKFIPYKIRTFENNCKTLSTFSPIPDLAYNHARLVKHLYHFWTRTFLKHGVPEPRNSIIYILAQVLQLKNVSDVYKNFSVAISGDKVKKIQKLCQLRLQRLPVQYILQEWDFCNLILKLKPPVFIPRPETEELVHIVSTYLKKNDYITNVLELCCGCGAISLSLLESNPNVDATAIDRSIDACNLTIQNAKLYDLHTRINVFQYAISKNNILQEMDEKFHVIVSNPPYVPSDQVKVVKPEIMLYEDLFALDGGVDGLDVIKSILHLAKEKLVSGGKLFMETDTSHPSILAKIINNYPSLELRYVHTYKDFCDHERFVELEKI